MEMLSCPQFLFGYDQGHSLIAGSERLPAQVEAFLSRHSDVPPGVLLGNTDQYWSGLPISDKQYALISTWSAPEMPRPGCVWSHVVILDNAVFDALPNLLVLQDAFRRPTGQGDRKRYLVPVNVQIESQVRSRNASQEAIYEVLRAVYEPNADQISYYRQSDRVEAVFEVWSQQWRELRNSFAFNTALQTLQTSDVSRRAMLQFLEKGRFRNLSPSIPSWIVELYRGLDEHSALHELLQSVGPDLPPEPSSVRFLARLFAFINGRELDLDLRAIKFAARELPAACEGTRLKTWLLRESLRALNDRQTLNLVHFLLSDDRSEAYPNLHEVVAGKLKPLWETLAGEIFGVIGEALAAPVSRFSSSIEILAQQAPPDALSLQCEVGEWVGRACLAGSRPELIDGAKLSLLPVDFLLSLVEISSEGKGRPSSGLIAELLHREPSGGTATIFEKWDNIFDDALIAELSQVEGVGSIHAGWKRFFETRTKSVVARALAMCSNTRSISEVLSFLGWPREPMQLGSAEQWLQFIKKAEDDTPLRSRQQLYATMLKVAFSDSGASVIGLFEYVVPNLYQWMKRSEIDRETEDYIMESMRHYYLMPFWDNCKRLKWSVRDAYEEKGFRSEQWDRLRSLL